MLKSTHPEIRKLLDEAGVPHDDPVIVQHDPWGGLPLADWKQQIADLQGALDWHDESAEVSFAPDCTVVAAHLFDTRHTPARDFGVERVVIVRAGPWDHGREAEINGQVVQRLEGAFDEDSWDAVHRGERVGSIVPVNYLALPLLEAFECPVTDGPVIVRFRTGTERGMYGEPSGWSDLMTLDTVYWRGATNHESPAIEKLMGATDPSGRQPSPPADPATCTEYIVARLAGITAPSWNDQAPRSVAEAVGMLDPGNKKHWTRRGKPRVDALTRLMGRRVTAAERNVAWKAFRK